jgi:uncharacterized membrane protein
MNLQLLQEASLATVIHLFFALSAFVLGAFQLLRPKGTQPHRVLGWIWVIMMMVISISSFWIKAVWPTSPFWGYSPIHLLSLFVLSQLALGVYFARKGNIKRHKQAMTYTYVGGLIIAGAFTFLPGRLMYQLFFG